MTSRLEARLFSANGFSALDSFNRGVPAPSRRPGSVLSLSLITALSLLGGCATTSGALESEAPAVVAPRPGSGGSSVGTTGTGKTSGVTSTGKAGAAGAPGKAVTPVAAQEPPPPPPPPPRKSALAEGYEALGNGSKAPDYKKALDAFERAAVDTPGDVRAPFNAGLVSERLGAPASAIPFYEEALKLDAGRAEVVYNLARAYASDGKADKAAEVYLKHLVKNPNDLKAKNNLAGVYVLLKNYDQAIKVLREVLAADPSNIQAYRNLAKVYFDQGNYKLSLLLSANALKLAPKDAGVLNNMGVTSLKLGDERAAIDSFKQAIENEPTHREANYNLGTIALKSGDYNLARTCFEAILKKLPGDIPARLGMAVALRGQGETEDAVKAYEAVLAAEPEHFIATYNLGIVQWKYLQDFDRSLQTLERCANISRNKPGDVDVSATIEAVRQAKKVYLEAKAAEEARLARERAEAERLAKEQAEKAAREAEQKSRLEALIGQAEEKVKGSKLPKAKLDPVRTAIEQCRQALELGDSDLIKEALEYLEGALAEIK